MRLARVLIATSRGTLELPSKSRDALLDEIRHVDSAQGIRDTFAAVGASRPAKFNRADEGLIIAAINVWAKNVGAQRLPAGIWGLRNALIDGARDE